jgi:hypothetical protein
MAASVQRARELDSEQRQLQQELSILQGVILHQYTRDISPKQTQ